MTKILVLIALLNTGELKLSYYAPTLPSISPDGVVMSMSFKEQASWANRVMAAQEKCETDAAFLNMLDHVISAWCEKISPMGGPEWNR